MLFSIKLVDTCIKLFWINSFCRLPLYWLLRKKNCLLHYYMLVIYFLLQEHFYGIALIKIFHFCKIKVIFKSTTRLSKFFRFKDKVSFNLSSNVVHKFSCGRCSATYYGENCRYLNIRDGEDSEVSSLTRKKVKD